VAKFSIPFVFGKTKVPFLLLLSPIKIQYFFISKLLRMLGSVISSKFSIKFITSKLTFLFGKTNWSYKFFKFSFLVLSEKIIHLVNNNLSSLSKPEITTHQVLLRSIGFNFSNISSNLNI
jgi:hypothetical protein